MFSLDGLHIRRPYVASPRRLLILGIAAIPQQLYGGMPFLISARLKGRLQRTKGIEIHGTRMWSHANPNRCVENPGSIRAWSIDSPTRWFDSTAVTTRDESAARNFHRPEKPTSRNQICRARRDPKVGDHAKNILENTKNMKKYFNSLRLFFFFYNIFIF